MEVKRTKGIPVMTPLAPTPKPRPKSVTVILILLFFLGVSATGGSLVLFVPSWAPPTRWLDSIPLLHSWTPAGFVLLMPFGLGSLFTALGMLRRWKLTIRRHVERVTHHHWSWFGTIVLGVGQVAWISLELVYIPDQSPLEAVYGGVGLALALLPLTPSARAYLHKGSPAGY